MAFSPLCTCEVKNRVGRRKKDSGRVERSYGIMPFILEEVEGTPSVTPRAGLVTVCEAARGMGLPAVADEAVQVKQRGRGCSNWEMLESFVLLIADGGEHVDDLAVLKADGAFVALLGHDIPSPSAGKKYLYGFHDDSQDAALTQQRALFASYVPAETAALAGLGRVNDHVVRQAQASRPERTATLDHDGTIIESTKREAAKTYEGTRGYQPSLVLWAEQDLVVADEFRDGNVPAQSHVLRVVQRAVTALPPGIEQVYYRADTASYRHELLNWLREADPATGRPRAIFGVSADMSRPLRAAATAASQWHRDPEDPCRSWAELDFVPSAPSYKKGRRPDRYLGIRIEARQKELFADGSAVKYYAVVTNDFERDGLELIHWQRQKAGTIEQTHDVLKNDLAAGVLPCARFGANAAWLRLNVLTYNLLSVLRRTALPQAFERTRPKRLRFHLFAVAATLIRHARQTYARIVGAFEVLAVRLSAVRRALWQQTPCWEATRPYPDTS
jgi:hypothetical protein